MCLSSYGPVREQPCVLTNTDISPEELHLFALEQCYSRNVQNFFNGLRVEIDKASQRVAEMQKLGPYAIIEHLKSQRIDHARPLPDISPCPSLKTNTLLNATNVAFMRPDYKPSIVNPFEILNRPEHQLGANPQTFGSSPSTANATQGAFSQFGSSFAKPEAKAESFSFAKSLNALKQQPATGSQQAFAQTKPASSPFPAPTTGFSSFGQGVSGSASATVKPAATVPQVFAQTKPASIPSPAPTTGFSTFGQSVSGSASATVKPATTVPQVFAQTKPAFIPSPAPTTGFSTFGQSALGSASTAAKPATTVPQAFAQTKPASIPSPAPATGFSTFGRSALGSASTAAKPATTVPQAFAQTKPASIPSPAPITGFSTFGQSALGSASTAAKPATTVLQAFAQTKPASIPSPAPATGFSTFGRSALGSASTAAKPATTVPQANASAPSSLSSQPAVQALNNSFASFASKPAATPFSTFSSKPAQPISDAKPKFSFAESLAALAAKSASKPAKPAPLTESTPDKELAKDQSEQPKLPAEDLPTAVPEKDRASDVEPLNEPPAEKAKQASQAPPSGPPSFFKGPIKTSHAKISPVGASDKDVPPAPQPKEGVAQEAKRELDTDQTRLVEEFDTFYEYEKEFSSLDAVGLVAELEKLLASITIRPSFQPMPEGKLPTPVPFVATPAPAEVRNSPAYKALPPLPPPVDLGRAPPKLGDPFAYSTEASLAPWEVEAFTCADFAPGAIPSKPPSVNLLFRKKA
ncbi:hypothetical protein L0F63_005477 [Massospora cicadina]|nr:hypothetical protein L0F63_005477 [Massospora cicadina]